MTKRNLEDIDQLFREGLHPEKDLVTFQEGDWSKLEQRLDRHERKKRGIFWLSRLGGVAALILLFFAIRMLWPESVHQVIQQAEVRQKDQQIKQPQHPSVASPEAGKTISTPNSGTNSMLAQNKSLEEKTSRRHPQDGKAEKQLANQDTLQVENLSVQKESTEPTIHSNEQNSTQSEPIKSPDHKRSAVEEPLLSGPTTQSDERHSAQTETIKSDKVKRSASDEALYAAIGEAHEQPIPESRIRRLALSVLAAPDYNGVNNLNNASLGNDFGLLVSYQVAKRWSFSTGGIYAKKLYETGFDNYAPNHNIWTEYTPKSVSADCRVLDIPLNINYTFLQRKSYSMSAGTGISSYLMLKEAYRFNYAENDNNSPLSYQVSNQNQHWLGVLNFQASFEQRLSSRVHIGLQPYMKIPLTNIGFAGVRLQSFGMAVHLSWNFNL